MSHTMYSLQSLCRSSIAVLLLSRRRTLTDLLERVILVVSQLFDDPQTFCAAFSKEYPIAFAEELWALYEAEGHCRPVTCPDVTPVDIDDSACLADGPHVKHRLVFGFDGGGVA